MNSGLPESYLHAHMTSTRRWRSGREHKLLAGCLTRGWISLSEKWQSEPSVQGLLGGCEAPGSVPALEQGLVIYSCYEQLYML